MYKVSGTTIHSYSSRYSFQATSRKSYFLVRIPRTRTSPQTGYSLIPAEHLEITLKDTTQFMALAASHLISQGALNQKSQPKPEVEPEVDRYQKNLPQ